MIIIKLRMKKTTKTKVWKERMGCCSWRNEHLYKRKVFKPFGALMLSTLEKRRVLASLIFLVEKKDIRIKDRTWANGTT